MSFLLSTHNGFFFSGSSQANLQNLRHFLNPHNFYVLSGIFWHWKRNVVLSVLPNARIYPYFYTNTFFCLQHTEISVNNKLGVVRKYWWVFFLNDNLSYLSAVPLALYTNTHTILWRNQFFYMLMPTVIKWCGISESISRTGTKEKSCLVYF